MECRICFYGPSEGRLITPCLCKGTIRYIHTTCLQRWRSQSVRAYTSCTQCLYAYEWYLIKTMFVLHLLYASFFVDVFHFLCYLCVCGFTPIGVTVIIGYKMSIIMHDMYTTYTLIQDITQNVIPTVI